MGLSLILSIIGLIFIFEASVAEAYGLTGDSAFFVKQQAQWLVLGSLLMFLGWRTPTSVWGKLAPLIYLAAMGLLLAVFIPGLGLELNGAQRWISLGGFTLQPVEAVKLGLIIFHANWMTKHQRLGPFLFLTLLPVGLLMLQPDLGSSLVVLATSFGMYFLAGADLKKLTVIGIAGMVGISALIISSPYRLSRLTTYLNPDHDPLGAGFHIRQITIALGNGGIFGRGLGQSRQKFSYIPEPSSDSIFAIIAEEIGFVGGTFLIGLLLLYIYHGSKILRSLPEKSFQYLLAGGIVIWFASQALLNLAAVAALVPLTGLPLPFISQGGTSLVMLLFATGILAATAREQKS